MNMIGKRLLMFGCVLSLQAKKYHVPINQRRTTHQDCTAQVELHTQSCFQREPVAFTCQFYGPRATVSDVKLLWSEDEPHMYVYPHPHVTDTGNMRTWSWSGVWYPQEPGVQRIPQMHVTYMYERRRKGRSGMLGSLWGGFAREQKEMRVPCTHTVTVKPIPDAAQHVDAVGTFGSCRWVNVPDNSEPGTTCEVGIQIDGAGSFPEIQPPHVSVADGCSCFYVGKQMEHPVHAYQVTFSYALHPHSPGTYVCEVDGWTIYDPDRDAVYKLHPGAMTLHVSGGHTQGADQAEETPLPQEDDPPSQTSHAQQPAVSVFRTQTMPSHIVLLCSLLPITIAGGRISLYIVRWWMWRTYQYRAVKHAFKVAHKAATNPDTYSPHDLYCNMLYVFHRLAAYTGLRDDLVQQHVVRYMPDYVDDWHDFWNRLEACAFSDARKKQDPTVYADARTWVSLLYKRWRRAQTSEGA